LLLSKCKYQNCRSVILLFIFDYIKKNSNEINNVYGDIMADEINTQRNFLVNSVFSNTIDEKITMSATKGFSVITAHIKFLLNVLD